MIASLQIIVAKINSPEMVWVLTGHDKINRQERYIAQLEDIMRLKSGEFMGQTVGASIPYFWTKTTEVNIIQQYPLTPFSLFKDNDHQVEMIKKF